MSHMYSSDRQQNQHIKMEEAKWHVAIWTEIWGKKNPKPEKKSFVESVAGI